MSARSTRRTAVLGRVVADLRKQSGRSQATLAALLGWDRSRLARIEVGRNTATIDDVFALEEVFLHNRLIAAHGGLFRLVAALGEDAPPPSRRDQGVA